MQYLEGKSASPGLCRGKAFIYRQPDLSYEKDKAEDKENEKTRLKAAFASSITELERIKSGLAGGLGEEYGHIFRAQMTMVEDDEFLGEIVEIIEKDALSAEEALTRIFNGYSEMFSSLGEDDYNRQRLADLADVYNRILRNLLGIEEVTLSDIPAGSIIIAEDLMPSDTAMMNRNNVEGLVSEKGGVTSHVAILAKSLNIPATVGAAEASVMIKSGDTVILDSTDFDKACVWINPDEDRNRTFITERDNYLRRKKLHETMKDLPAVTTDGREIKLSANIGSLEDLENAVSFGAGSVGLLRTEFFFLGTSKLPTEEQQFEFYKKAAEKLDPGMLVIRTLDIGGDKEVKCFSLPEEDNPFLGLRGVRVCLEYRDIFKTQLRAIMRAAVFGNIKVMFPMIADVGELRTVREIINEAASELESEAKQFRNDFEIGVMVETPAAALLSDLLTEECDFVSIGTNDLTQYVLTADRINRNVSSYYRIFSPAVFRAIGMTAANAHKNNSWAGVCGELGGIPLAIPVLVGLGIDELSMSGQMLPEAVALIRSLSYEKCRKAAEKILNMKTEEEIKNFLRSEFNQ